jgi:hypothetical protein
MGYVMKHFDLDLELGPISKIHGQSFETEAVLADGSQFPLTVATFYHPAAALYNGGMRDVLKKDFEILKRHIGTAPLLPK